MCFPFFQYKMVKTKWKKSLDLEKFHPKNWKQVIFLKSCMHFSDTVLALGIYVYVYIFCKQLCQQKTSHLDIVTISRQYRAASRQWLLSNNIIQDLALACPTYSICLLGEFWQGLSIHNHQSDRCSTNGVKIWSLLSDLIIKVQEPKGKSGQLTR